MNYLDDFYYLEKNEDEYTDDSDNAEFDSDRYVDGAEKYWKKEGKQAQPKPKTLILADWTLCEAEGDDKLDRLHIVIRQMLRDGFTIYFWQGDHLKKLTNADMIFDGVIRVAITPALEKDILHLAKNKKKLSSDKTKVLSDYEIGLLIGNSPKSPRYIDKAVFDRYQDSIYEPVVRAFLQQNTISLKTTLRQVFWAEIFQQKNWINKRAIKNNYWDFSTVYTEALPVLSYEVGDPDLSSIDSVVCKLIKKIEIEYKNGNFAKSCVSLLQNNTLSITDLTLRFYDKVFFNEYFPKLNFLFHHLKRIKFGMECIEIGKLFDFLKKCKNIRELDLYESRFVDNNNPPPKHLELNALQTLHTNAYNDASTTLQQSLLKAAPNLRDLKITLLDMPPHLHLEKLEILELEISGRSGVQTKILLSDFVQFFKNKPCLKNITLHGNEALMAAFLKLTAVLLLEKVETLILKSSFSSSDPLMIDDDVLPSKSASLPHLKKLNASLCDEQLNVELLCDFLNASPNLNELRCRWNTVFPPNIPPNLPKLLSLEHLKYFHFAGCSYVTGSRDPHDNVLVHLLGAMPHLEKLELGNLVGWRPVDLSLHSVKTFTLNDATRGEYLTDFLNGMPNVQELHLAGDVSGTSSSLALASLKELRFIDCGTNSTVEADFLIQLLDKSPHLQKIDVNYLLVKETTQENQQKLEALLSQIPCVEGRDKLRYEFASTHQPNSSATPSETIPAHQNQHAPVGANQIRQALSQATTSPNNIICDTNTLASGHEAFHVKQIFWPTQRWVKSPDVCTYRLNAYNRMQLDESAAPETPQFLLSSVTNSDRYRECNDLIQCDKDVFAWGKDEKDTFYGKHTFTLKPGEWQPIPSLSPHEKMTHVHVAPSWAKIQIKYCRENNFYYLCSPTQQTLTLDFLIKIELKPEPRLPKEIIAFFDQFKLKRFSSKKFNPPEKKSLEQVVAALLKQETGACRHRAACAKYEIDKLLKTESQIITNGAHVFIEFTYDGQRMSRDLGGYRAKITHDKANAPNRQVEKITDHSMQLSRGLTAGSNHVSRSVDSVAKPREDDYKNRPGQLKKSDFLRYFETWDKAEKTANSAEDYFESLFSQARSKHLLCLSQTKILDTAIALQAHAQKISRPTLYIHSPDELKCYKKYLTLNDDGSGTQHKEFHGKLYQLLSDTHHPPVLVINLSQFTTEDIIHHQDLFSNDDARLDGISLPRNTTVICLMDPKAPHHTSHEDIFTYIQKEGIHQFPEDLVEPESPVFPIRKTVEPMLPAHSIECERIQLNHRSWYSKLIGKWELEGGQFIYKEGALISALKSGKPIEIHNPPYQADSSRPSQELEFHFFWQQIRLNGKFEDKLGNEITVSKEDLARINLHEGYAWERLQQSIDHIDYQYDPNAHILNPTRLTQFLRRKKIENQQLYPEKGILESSPQTTIAVYLTRDLAEDEWAQLLEACQQAKKKLAIHCAPSVNLPEHFPKPVVVPEPPVIEWNKNALDGHTIVMQTEDADTTIEAVIKATKETWIVLDISECKMSHLVKRIREIKAANQAIPQFTEEEQALLILLQQKKNVILKGQLSPTLLDELSAFIQERQGSQNPSGRLLVLSQTTMPAMNVLVHTLTEAEKSQVNHREKSIEHEIERFCVLPLNVISSDFDPKTSEAETKAFIDRRIQMVEEHLEKHPYVFLGGLTGVGKSAFIKHDFNDPTKRKIYVGNDTKTRKDWASGKESAPHQYKVLGIDEATLLETDFTEFEGLFYDPPWILIDGKPVELTEKHKVIFMGNPLSYGNRKLAALFVKHGLLQHFEPLPKCFLYEKIIKPVFDNTTLSSEAIINSATELLQVYEFLVQRSQDEIRISPREIQMMALLTARHCEKNAISDLKAVSKIARHYAHQISHSLLSSEEYDALLAQSPLEIPLDKPGDRLETKLDELLYLREYRQSERTLNQAQKTGGLGGLLIENDIERNQERNVLKYLHQHGTKATLDKDINYRDVKNSFYVIPPNMSDDDTTFYILKAFHEGAIVYLKDPNTTRLPERLLNDLLMGTLPEELRSENKPIRPGFTLIATQVPATEGSRRSLSPALLHRLQQYQLPFYSKEELLNKPVIKKLPEDVRNQMVDAFLERRQYAELNHLSPKPRWAHLQRCALEWYKKMVIKDLPQSSYFKRASASTNMQEGITIKDLQDILSKYAVKNTMTRLGNKMTGRTMGPQGVHQSREYRALFKLTQKPRGKDELISFVEIEQALETNQSRWSFIGASRATLFRAAYSKRKLSDSDKFTHQDKDSLDTNEIIEQLGELVAKKSFPP